MDFKLFMDSYQQDKKNGVLKKTMQNLLTWLQYEKLSEDRNPAMVVLSNSNQRNFSSHAKECICLLWDIIHTHYDPEVLILAASCIAFTLVNCLDQETALFTYLELCLSSGSKTVDIDEILRKSTFITIKDASCVISFNYCAFLCGLLNCRQLCSICVQCSTKSFLKIQSVAVQLCQQNCLHKFHCFKLMENWYKSLEHFIVNVTELQPNFLDDKSEILTSTILIVNSNWENPINGIMDCVKVIYKLLLNVFIRYCKLTKRDPKPLILNQVIETSKLPWSSKAKYRRMSVLIGFISVETMIEMTPSLPEMMLNNLAINCIASAITELYKMILKSLADHPNGFQLWQNLFCQQVANSLKSKNIVVYNNTTAHVLPSTLKTFPESRHDLLECLKDNPLAIVLLKRLCRKTFSDKGEPISPQSLTRLLTDTDEEVRFQAFQLLVESYKFPTVEAFEAIIQFLSQNLNIDNPSFRQKLVAFISRLLSSLLFRTRNKQKKIEEHCFNLQKFLSDYFVLLSDNIIPGTSFQRRTTTLLLLDSLFDLDHLSVEAFPCHLLSKRLILCVLDRDDGIRKLCHSILLKVPEECLNLPQFAETAFCLMNSPRHHESHGGALLISVCCARFRPFTTNDVQYSESSQLLEALLFTCEQQFQLMADRQLLKAASHFPLHGSILGITCSLCKNVTQILDHTFLSSYVLKCKALASSVVESMLTWISEESNTGSNASPSFLDMSQTLSKVIENETGSCDLSTIPLEFQYLLTYYWLSIKESCLLLSRLVQLQQELDYQILDSNEVLFIGKSLVDVLFRCRHKGAIEACCISLTCFSTSSLYLNKRFSFTANPVKELLIQTLSVIVSHSLSSNITRRSAGLCLIIQGLLCGEAVYIAENSSSVEKTDAGICQFAIENLMTLATKSDLIPEQMDATIDNPRAVSLHVLRTVVNANLLTRFVQPYLEALLKISLSGLFSKEWSIRNASLQLYGACSQKILGQKKIKDNDEYLTDTLTAKELILKFPSLMETLESYVENGVKKQASGLQDYALVPVLSLLSSISVCGSNPTVSTELECHLFQLLKSKIWKVRCLAARSLLSIVNVESLNQTLNHFLSGDLKQESRNEIHGFYCLVQCLRIAQKREEAFNVDSLESIYESLSKAHLQSPVRVFQTNTLTIDPKSYDNQIREHHNNSTEEVLTMEAADSKVILLINEDRLNQVRERCNKNLDLDERLESAKWAIKVSKLIKTNEMADMQHLFRFYDCLFCLLQDEDHDVRESGSLAVSTLLDIGYIPSFNVAGDLLMEELIRKAKNKHLPLNIVCNYFWTKLEEIECLTTAWKGVGVSSVSEKAVATGEVARPTVIFEEERNLFAEIVKSLMKLSVKLMELLNDAMESKGWHVPDSSIERLKEEATTFIIKVNDLELITLMKLGINRMSSFYSSLLSFALRVKIVSSFDNQKRIAITSSDEMTSVLKETFLRIGLEM